MGGARIDKHGKASLQRLFVAGEDAGGVHGGNRLGGNGICESCVYGRQAGKALARFIQDGNRHAPETAPGLVSEIAARFIALRQRSTGEGPFRIRDELREINWAKVGIVRNGPDLEQALSAFTSLRSAAENARVTGPQTYNMPWNITIDLLNMIDVSLMSAACALARKESRAAHYRSDYPEQDDVNSLYNIFLTRGDQGRPDLRTEPTHFKHKSLHECQKYRK
jgi:succinate dehydrogenase / fumarate reductase flavoprotein subunit/fumarate reductase flavoprotein subunit